MDTAKTLFQSIGIPRQVVVYHQMRALKVDAFASSIRSDQDAHADILLEELFYFSPFITEHSAVDGNNSFAISEQGTNLFGKVVERVLVFREDDQFFTLVILAIHRLVILKQRGKLIPFSVNTADTDIICHLFKALQCLDFNFKLCDGCRSGSVVYDFLLNSLLLIRREIIVIVYVISCIRVICRAFAHFLLCKAMLQALASAAQRLINCLRRRSKAALQYRKSKTDSGLAFIVQVIRAVELFLHIVRDCLI